MSDLNVLSIAISALAVVISVASLAHTYRRLPPPVVGKCLEASTRIGHAAVCVLPYGHKGAHEYDDGMAPR